MYTQICFQPPKHKILKIKYENFLIHYFKKTENRFRTTEHKSLVKHEIDTIKCKGDDQGHN